MSSRQRLLALRLVGVGLLGLFRLGDDSTVPGLQIDTNYLFISSSRVTRTESDFIYRAKVVNTSPTAVEGVTATLTSRTARTRVIDGSLTFGTVPGNATVTSTDTFTIRQDRSVPFNPADLVWDITGTPVPRNTAPMANAGPDQTGVIGQLITLDGSASSDRDGDALSFPQVIALAPEYILPQDGHEQQDGEQAAGKRWRTPQAATLVPHHVTLLGDDLYSQEPFCSLALQQGCNFILVCKPDSHTKWYERVAFWQAQGASAHREQRCRKGRVTEGPCYRFIHDVLRQDGRQARSVNWVEMTVINATTGAHLYDNPLITNHHLSSENVTQVAQAGRRRWKIAHENNNGLKSKGYHLEHNFGHGQQYRSATMLRLNLLAFLFHTVL